MGSFKDIKQQMRWLADSPLFIDAEQVSRFYDAVVQPAFLEGKTTIEVSRENAASVSGKVAVSAEVEPNKIFQAIATVFPFINFKVKGEVDVETGTNFTSTSGTIVERHPIVTPQRQLVLLAVHYLANLSDRIQFVDTLSDPSWRNEDFISESPRAIVFLDIPVRAPIIPTAAEFANGRVELLYKKLEEDVRRCAGSFVEYPSRPDRDQARRYWEQFKNAYSATRAMTIIEEAATSHGSKINWIDFRLPLSDEGDTLHLHCVPDGQFHTGVFAYNFVKRGFKHGIRIVGTLKSEPDINVLAIYER